jgi:hypothetical protein
MTRTDGQGGLAEGVTRALSNYSVSALILNAHLRWHGKRVAYSAAIERNLSTVR